MPVEAEKAQAMAQPTIFWTPQAWLPSGWARDVRLTVAPDGTWQQVESGVAKSQAGAAAATVNYLDTPVWPGVVNAHRHAFQRAIAGLTERSGGPSGDMTDDFWSWRDRMYRAALQITPTQLEATTTQLYAELLQGGYTQVCEFHYLHNDVDGQPYADPLEMSLALVRAAQVTGIGLTLLPVLYMHSGFAVQRTGGGLRDEQRRFASTPESVLRISEAVNGMALPRVTAGLALHSLRAVDPGALKEASTAAARRGWPIHIHISEQTQEVDDCIAHHGQRPVEWLLNHASVNSRWNLVHATHTNPQELAGIQATGASVVICPSTEANLGDGVFDLPTHLQLKANWSIGSDSHATRRLSEELRLLEYSQRFARRERNVAARASGADSTAATLFNGAIRGGAAASGLPLGGLVAGQRADFCLLDTGAASLAGIPAERLLDAWVFSSPDALCSASHVGGRAVPAPKPAWQAGFTKSMRTIWGD